MSGELYTPIYDLEAMNMTLGFLAEQGKFNNSNIVSIAEKVIKMDKNLINQKHIIHDLHENISVSKVKINDKNYIKLSAAIQVNDSEDIINAGSNGFILTTTGVSEGTYGSSSAIPTITVDSKGRITEISNNTVDIQTTITLSDSNNQHDYNVGGVLSFMGTSNQIVSRVSPDMVTFKLADNIITPGNLTVTGNLIVNGDTTTISSTVKTIQDNMIELASGNPADTLDTGIYMRYTQNGNIKSSGIYRSASDGRFYFYNYNADVLPGATVDSVSSYYQKAHVSVNNLNADSINVLGTTKSEITTSTISIFAGNGVNNIVDFNTSLFAVMSEPLSLVGSYLRSNIYFQTETTNYENRTTNFYYEANTGRVAIGQNAIGSPESIVNAPVWNPNANLHIINTPNAGTSTSPAFQIGGTTNPSYSIHTDGNNVYFSSFLNGYDFTFSGTSTMKINRSGSIEFNSSSGNQGQVLVSNGGTLSPTWQTPFGSGSSQNDIDNWNENYNWYFANHTSLLDKNTKLDHLFNVNISSGGPSGNFLYYDTVANKWVDRDVTTTDITEGNNMYFTGSRVRESLDIYLENTNNANGNGISYQDGIITNTAPDQTVTLTGGSNVTITGDYPNFTISSTDTDTNTTYSAGDHMNLVGTTFHNTAPDQTVTLTGGSNVTITGDYPNFTIGSTDTNTTYTAGDHMNLVGTTFHNTAPDQTVTLTGGSNVTITGDYPNFTIGSTDTNTTYTAGSGINIDDSNSISVDENYNFQLSNLTVTNTITGSVSSLSNHNTDSLNEGTNNLYYTDTRVRNYLTTNSYATQSYVQSKIGNLIDSAPAALDTLNELAAALGDDANFSTNILNAIGEKWTQDNTKIANWDAAYSWVANESGDVITTKSSINELGDVQVDSSVSSGDILIWNSEGWISQTPTTSIISEGTNLYYTTQRVDEYFESKTHSDISYINGVIKNTAPDQIVKLNPGDNITITGDYPNFTISSTDTDTNTTYSAGDHMNLVGTTFHNTAPDQTVTLTGGSNVTITGDYPNFTISSTDTDTNTTYSAGDHMNLVGTTFHNTAPDQTVTLTGGSNVTITGNYPNFTISSTDTDTNTTYSAGDHMNLVGTTFHNTAPDQTVTLTHGDNLTLIVSGSYPNFKVDTRWSIGEGLYIDIPTETLHIGQSVIPSADVTFNDITSTGTISGNLTGNVTGTVSSLNNHNTDSLNEGTNNKYYSEDLFNNSFERKTIGELENVNTAGIQSGQYLQWNGSRFIPVDINIPTSSGISGYKAFSIEQVNSDISGIPGFLEETTNLSNFGSPITFNNTSNAFQFTENGNFNIILQGLLRSSDTRNDHNTAPTIFAQYSNDEGNNWKSLSTYLSIINSTELSSKEKSYITLQSEASINIQNFNRFRLRFVSSNFTQGADCKNISVQFKNLNPAQDSNPTVSSLQNEIILIKNALNEVLTEMGKPTIK